ncbi:hypothetical protein QM467_04970 [Rhodoblastus sp. 17X3]|uniref:hypothetical protein n=1 Tax=Rhodoblastus sp. 17X3 TaxID=3047026 RepID=UPI0024B70633|nr:hypothetical protein [Rhodoblastus sp. 17X3]MDI9847413.1 hypothetical protein [Rhodoblastus sp. 17X3]
MRFRDQRFIIRSLGDRRIAIKTFFKDSQSVGGASKDRRQVSMDACRAAQLVFRQSLKSGGVLLLAIGAKSVGQPRMRDRRFRIPASRERSQLIDIGGNFEGRRPFRMKGAAAMLTKQRRVLQFVTREIFRHAADFVAFRFGRQIAVKGEGALLVADREGQRFVSSQFGAARFVLIITGRRLPFYLCDIRPVAEKLQTAIADLARMPILHSGKSVEQGGHFHIALPRHPRRQTAITGCGLEFQCLRHGKEIIG